jgi:hypothetical protein
MLRSKARVKKHLHLVPSPYLLLEPIFNPVMLNLVSETPIQFKDGKFIVFRSKSRKFGVFTLLPWWVIIDPRHQIGASCCWLFTHTWGYSPACLTPSLPSLQGGPHRTTWVLVLSFDHSHDQLFAGLPHFMILWKSALILYTGNPWEVILLI